MATGLTFDLNANISGFKTGINSAVGSLNSFKGAISGILSPITSLASSIAGINTLSLGFQGLEQAISGIKTAVTDFKEFEYEMYKIKAVSESTKSEMKELENLIVKTGKSSQFSVQSIAEGVFNLSTLGVKGIENFKNLVPAIDSAATSLDTNFNRAAEVVLSTIRTFNLELKDSWQVADMLTGAYTNSSMNLEKWAIASQYAGLAAKAFGKGLGDVLPLIMALNDQGIDASITGTAIRMAFLSLVRPSGGAKKALQEMGIALKDVDANTKSFIDIIELFQKKNLDMGQAARIFGVRAAPAVLALIKIQKEGKAGADVLRDYQKKVYDTGISLRHTEEKQNALAFSFRKLSQNTDLFSIATGKSIANAIGLRDIVETITAAFGKLTDIVNAVNLDVLKQAGISIFDPGELTQNLQTVFKAVLPAIADYFGSAALFGGATLLEYLALQLPTIVKQIGVIAMTTTSKIVQFLATGIIDLIALVAKAMNNIMANMHESIGKFLQDIPGFEGMAYQYKQSAKEKRRANPQMEKWFTELKGDVGVVIEEANKYIVDGWKQAIEKTDMAGEIGKELQKATADFVKSKGLTKEEITRKREVALSSIQQIPTERQKNAFSNLITNTKSNMAMNALGAEKVGEIGVSVARNMLPYSGSNSVRENYKMMELLAISAAKKLQEKIRRPKELMVSLAKTAGIEYKPSYAQREFTWETEEKMAKKMSEMKAKMEADRKKYEQQVINNNNQGQVINNYRSQSRQAMLAQQPAANPRGDRQ